MSTALIAADKQELSVEDVREQVNKVQTLMKDLMQENEHYGVIPGTSKPTLYKAGAEKLGFTFRLIPKYEVEREDLPDHHRGYEVICSLYHMNGTFVGQGVGNCSTMETKYRYRTGASFEVLDEPIPADAKERKTEYRRQGFGMRKVDGQWRWVRYNDEKAENQNIADTYNTVKKMAKKRAYVDAMITACAASDIFTQDLEEVELPAKPAPEEKSVDRRLEGGYKACKEIIDWLFDNKAITEGQRETRLEILEAGKNDLESLKNLWKDLDHERNMAKSYEADIANQPENGVIKDE